jgi:hypothetical protein
MDDQESERKVVPQRNREEFHLEVARLLKRTCEDLGNYTVIAKNSKGQMMDVKLSEVKIDDSALVYSIAPTAWAAKGASARTQLAEDLMKLGVLQPQDANRFLDIPDTQRSTILLNARADLISQQLEDMIYEGLYEGPDPMMDLTLARSLAGSYYAFAKRMKVDEDRLQMLRDFAVECEKLPQVIQSQQNLATIGPGMQAVAGLPGAPPAGPPPGPPMPPPGMNGAPS